MRGKRGALLALSLMALLAAALLNPFFGAAKSRPVAASPAGRILADHTSTDIKAIPESAILQAKNDLHVAYGHTSHGSQIPTGMDGLVGFMNGLGYPHNLYDWNEDGSGGALRIDDCFVPGDLGNPDRVTWAQRTRDYLGAPDAQGRGSLRPTVNVVMWSWCGQVDGSESDIATYCLLMDGLETEYFGVNFVYMTGHLNGSGEAGNVNQRNQQIRNWCAAGNRILYDFADIESYDPDGLVNYMQLGADDECDYSGGNWALDWQASHTEGVDWYNCSPAHTKALNGNLKAYAAWWMFARIAGWDGNPEPTGPTFSPTYGHAGDTVTISGEGFGAGGTVTIGGAAVINVISWNDTQIVAEVPAGAAFGKVVVSGGSGIQTSAVDWLPVEDQWYFAEGYTGYGTFQEYLCLGNLGGSEAHARAVYLYTDGTSKEQDATIPEGSRATINVNAGAGANKSLSALVVADQPIVAERPMYFNYGGWTGGHDVIGAKAPAYAWYFAEGYTGTNFEEYVCVLNPGGDTAYLNFRFQVRGVGEVVKPGYSVGPRTRGTFKVNDVLGPGYECSLMLESSEPVVAERPMYFNYGGWTGGHCVMGTPVLSNEYFFAEGTTRGNFDEYLTIQNPGLSAVTVDAVYQLGEGQGANVSKSYVVGPGERATVIVENEVGTEKDVSVRLTSADAFLAERPMYFNYGGAWTGGHCVIGAASPNIRWFFAEGYTGDGFDEWLCLQNPGATEAVVAVTYFTQEEGALAVRNVTVPAGTRKNVYVNENAGRNYQLSTLLVVTAGPGVVVERPMYFNWSGWTGGHDVVGYPVIPN